MSVQPDPRDTRDLALDVANGRPDISEDTLAKAREEILKQRKQAEGELREQWSDALAAVHAALSAVRQERENT